MSNSKESKLEERIQITKEIINMLVSKFSDKRLIESLKNPEELIEKIPEEGKFALYSEKVDELRELLSNEGIEVVSTYPIINCIVIKTTRNKLINLVINELVSEFDVIRKVEALEGE